MNSNKKDGWVLCPSKSLPGKYYYFNVVSGQAVWSLPDAKVPPNNKIQNVAEKSHSVPEPEPIKHNDINTAPNLQQSITNNTLNKHANRPMFGQITFPEYMPNVNPSSSTNYSSSIFMSNNNDNRPLFGQATPKVVWTSLPLMVLEPNGTQTLDQVTQTCELDNIIVHSCDIPLSKRFINYRDITIHFSKENKLISNKISTSTPIKPNPTFVDPIKPTIEQKIRKKPLIKDAILDIKNLKISDKKYSSTPTSNLFLQNQSDREQNILHNEKKTFAGLNLEVKDKEVAIKKDDDHLDQNDLRLFLMARKRRHTEGEINTGSCESKKIKLKFTEDLEELQAPKKRVTFATNNTNQFQTSKEISNDYILTIQTLRNLAQSNCRQDVWYIVVDMNVLLENYEFLNNLVLSDETCRLLIPEALRRGVEAMCAGASAGRAHVLAARHVTRALRHAPPHLAVRTNMADTGSKEFFSDTNMSSIDDIILKCCLLTMKQKYHVVLLSNDEELVKTASVLNIHAYKFDTIKHPTNKSSDVQDLNTNKSDLFLSTKFLSSRTHKMFQNIPGLIGEKAPNTIRPNKSIFDDDSVTTEMTSEINRVIQSLKTQNHDPNPKEEIHKNPFLFQKPSSLENQAKDANKDTTNKNPAENKIVDQKAELQKQNVNINVQNSNNKEKDSERIKHMQMSVESNLKGFCITYKAMEGTVKERIEEWTCIFTQIMENALCYVLQKSSFRADLILPWTVHEMIERIKLLYEDRLMLNVVIDKMLSCMSQCMTDRGKRNPDIKAQVFIRTMGCGILLIQCLKGLLPDCEELSNTKQSLINLLRTIEHPIDIDLDNTPKPSHSNVDEKRRNYTKQPSEIISYLKQHYEDWRSYGEMPHPEPKRCNMMSDQENLKVFRISGKNLNMLKIDNKNTMTITKCSDGAETKTLECISENPESNIENNTDMSAGPILLKQNKRPSESAKRDNSSIIKAYNIDQKSNVTKSNSNSMLNHGKMTANDLNVSFNDDTFDTSKFVPKVTRCVSVIEEYEKRIIRRALDMDALDYSDINDYDNKNETRHTLSDTELRDDETNIIDVGNHSTNDYGKYDSGYNNSQNTNDILISDNKKKISNSKDCGVNKANNVVEKDNISMSDYSTIPITACATKTPEKIYKINTRKTKHDSNSGGNKEDFGNKNDHTSIFDSSINNTNDNTNSKPKKVSANVPINTKHNSDSVKNKCDTRKDDQDVSVSDTTSDSGIGKDSHMAYSFVKMFLSQLSCTFIKTHAFMIENLDPLREERLSNDEKTCLHERIGKALKHMGDIINKLKSTIERESNENRSLYTLLHKDEEAAKDERIIRYRSVLRKCLEQAKNLQNAMKIMHSITDANWDGSLSDTAESIRSSITHFNIFE